VPAGHVRPVTTGTRVGAADVEVRQLRRVVGFLGPNGAG